MSHDLMFLASVIVFHSESKVTCFVSHSKQLSGEIVSVILAPHFHHFLLPLVYDHLLLYLLLNTQRSLSAGLLLRFGNGPLELIVLCHG